MPYIKQESRPKLDRILSLMVEERIQIKDLSNLLFAFGVGCIKPSYNNFKNFIGELRQCAAEMERRQLQLNRKLLYKMRLEMHPGAIPNTALIIRFMTEMEVKVDGDLNYILFKFCKYYTGKRKRFSRMLRNCALKIEKKLLAPYEDEKIKENGDV